MEPQERDCLDPGPRPLLARAPGFPALEPVHEERFHPELAAWRRNVGAPVALDLAPVAAPEVAGLDVVCWNVAVGHGDIEALLARIRAGREDGFGVQPERPLVLLLQEAFRAGDAVPAEPHDARHGGRRIAPGRTDVVVAARNAGLSIRYTPSMRNGHHRSDRGNAILASVALEDTHSFLLPHVRQRRVAVTTHLSGIADVVLATAHLDTGGAPRAIAARRAARGLRRYGAGRLVQANELIHRLVDPEHTACVVLGADLNTALGVRDPVVRALVTAGFHPAKRVGSWRHTYHARVRLLLDHVLYRSPTGRIARVRVTRVDEAAGDRSARVFGSDHHPLFARVDFRSPSDGDDSESA